jgi:hypothetical protein
MFPNLTPSELHYTDALMQYMLLLELVGLQALLLVTSAWAMLPLRAKPKVSDAWCSTPPNWSTPT